MSEPLRRLLRPRSIAIVGLSADRSKHGHRVLANLRKLRFDGTIHGVHPDAEPAEPVDGYPGVTRHPSLADLPEVPDVAVCAVPAPAVAAVARSASERGVGTLVVFAGGFAEAGRAGQAMQAALAEEIDASELRVLGPNSGGVIVPGIGAAMSFLTCLDRPPDQLRSGPVGVVTQSGGLGSYLHNLAAARGGGLAASISTGNEVDIDLADGIEALIDLDDVRVIALVLETVRNGPRFVRAVERANRAGKPVVATRIGRSIIGRTLMRGHTGALATPDRVLTGVLDGLGVGLTETPGELLDVAEVAAATVRPAGRRVGVVTHSGGLAILLGDLGQRAGLDFPTPGPDLAATVEPLLQQGSVANPLDMGGIIGGPGRFGEAVSAFAASGRFDMVLAVSSAHPPAHSIERARTLLASDWPVPVVHLWMAGDLGAAGLDLLRQAGAATVEEPRAAIAALAAMTGQAMTGSHPRPSVPMAGDPDVPMQPSTPAAPARWSEREAKDRLLEWGVPAVEGAVATDATAASAVADRLGYPVVVKISSPDIAHKTEVDGIRTGLRSPSEVENAVAEVVASARGNRPDATIDGVLVERQVDGIEVLVGAVRDPTFGPMVVVGTGGVAAEVLDDALMHPAPLSEAQGRRLIDGLAGRRLLTEPRSGRPADLDRLARVLTTLGDLLASETWTASVEVNPLVWDGQEWLALDVVIDPL